MRRTVMYRMTVIVEDRQTYMAAKIKEMGTFVYGADVDELKTKAERLLDFMENNLPQDALLNYFNRRGIPYQVIPASTSDEDPEEHGRSVIEREAVLV